MPDARSQVSSGELSNTVARVVWGLLLIWTGAAVLLHWGWGVGLVGAGAILLGAQAFRRSRRVDVDRFGLVAGLLLVVCGVWRMFDVAVELVPLLFIAAGIALLVSTRIARGARGAPGARADLHAPPQARA